MLNLRAVEVIGTNSLLTFTDAIYNRDYVAWNPGNGATVTLNPPRFRWPYNDTKASETCAYAYRFQCAYDSDWGTGTNAVDVFTVYNFYNMLNRFGSNTVYWRIGYTPSTNVTLTNWSATRSFTISGSATVWDRGMFADTNFLATNAWHPRIQIQKTNRTDIKAWLKANFDPNYRTWSNAVLATTGYSNEWWWTCPMPAIDTNKASAVFTSEIVNKILYGAYVWQIESNYTLLQPSNMCNVLAWAITNYCAPTPHFFNYPFFEITNVPSDGNTLTFNGDTRTWKTTAATASQITIGGTIGACVDNLASHLGTNPFPYYAWFEANPTTVEGFPSYAAYDVSNTVSSAGTWLNYFQAGGEVYNWRTDAFADPQIRAMAHNYDWLHSEFTANQKLMIEDAFNRYAEYQYTNMVWFSGITTNGQHIGYAGRSIPPHPYASIMACTVLGIAAYDVSTNCQKLLDAAVNYMAGVGHPNNVDEDGLDRGHGYSDYHLGVDTYGYMDIVGQLATTYPLQGWTNLPGIRALSRWYVFYNPVGMRQNGDDPGGNGGVGYAGQAANLATYYASSYGAVNAARLTHDPEVQMWQLRWKQNYLIGGADDVNPSYNIAIPYYYPTNASPVELTNTAAIYPYGGWVFACSTSVVSHSAFTNGVGIQMSFRPQSSDNQLSFPSDGHPDIWAYGARIGAGGAGYGGEYRWTGMARDLVGVDGVWPSREPVGATGTTFPSNSVHSRLFAYQQGTNYVYWAGDTTSNYTSAPWVTKAERHTLFMRGKYFVMFDNFGSRSNSTFAWTWHVQEAVYGVTPTNFTFTCTNLYTPSLVVSTKVFIANAPASINVSNVARSANFTNASVVYNAVTTNIFTGAGIGNGSTPFPNQFRANVLYVTNVIAGTNFTYLSVVYPVKAGDSLPTFTRLSDRTLTITNGSDGDVISFNETNALSTLVVDTTSAGSNPEGGPGEESGVGSAILRGVIMRGAFVR